MDLSNEELTRINHIGIIESMKEISSILGHKLQYFTYGLMLASDFYMGSFTYLYEKIPIKEYEKIHEIIKSFYQENKIDDYEIYSGSNNIQFINQISCRPGYDSTITDTGMSLDLIEYSANIFEIKANEDLHVIQVKTSSEITKLTVVMKHVKPRINIEKQKEYLAKLIDSRKFHFWLALLKDVPVGMRTVFIYPDHKKKMLCAQGYSNYVIEEFRRHGVAQHMMCYAIQIIKTFIGVKIFTNQVTEDGHKFCTKFGLKEHNEKYYHTRTKQSYSPFEIFKKINQLGKKLN